MARMIEITCKCGCGKTRTVRLSDVKRGWGLFYNKSCKATWQEKQTGQCRAYLRGEGVSHNAKRKNKDPEKAIIEYCKRTGRYHPALKSGYDLYGYGHLHVSGDEGHGQD
jgi:hypothetical protein